MIQSRRSEEVFALLEVSPVKAQIVKEAALSQLGAPYVYGAWGGYCTPTYRRQYLSYNPTHTAIKTYCQVLSGKAKTCDGCKYEGSRAFDCRGFTHWCLDQAGIEISGGGATSQYNKDQWSVTGPISEMPNVVCCVFQRKAGTTTMLHTGIHIGDGVVIHCSGEVKKGSIPGDWTHYAVPRGLYDEIEEAEKMPLKNGSVGDEVKVLQELLSEAGYDPGKIDGKFGPKTEAALKAYQTARGEDATGIASEETLEGLKILAAAQTVNIPLSLAKEMFSVLKERIQEV